MTKKKSGTPPLLRFVRWFFPKLERVSPALALRYFNKVFFTPLRYPTPPKEVKSETYASRFQLQVDTKTVQGYEWGTDKPYILVVHGWAGRSTQFRRFVKPLIAKGYRVVGFDGPAHGNSTGKQTNILEFQKIMNQLVLKFGPPHGVIAHSFGGVAVLLSMVYGLPVTRLVNVASPTLGDEVIKTFLRAIHGTWETTGLAFKKMIESRLGKSFDEFSGLWAIQHLPGPIELLLVHDSDDKDVTLSHSHAIMEVYPTARLFQTSGLGHTRILRDNTVITEIVTFLTAEPS